MWPFKRKNTYLITWCYGKWESEHGLIYSDLIRATSFGSAWKKLKKSHSLPIYMIKVEKVE